MKILIASQQLIPHIGGLSTHVEFLMAHLRQRGHSVALVEGSSAEGPPWLRYALAAQSLGRRDVMRMLRIRAAIKYLRRALERALTESWPDLIHCHDPFALVAVDEALRGQDVPLVETVHGPALYEVQMMSGGRPLPRYFKLLESYERLAFARARRLIAVDSGQARILCDDYGVDRSKVRVIFNCVDVELVRRLADASPAASAVPDGPFFVVPRRLVTKTGVRYAIEAMAHLGQQDVHLLVCGQGPLLGELQALSAALGLTAQVHFMGSVPRESLMPLFARSVGVIVPSVPAAGVIEATSLAVTEAMAVGTVPIASSIGGLAELIESGQTGLLVPPADSRALAAAMASLLEPGVGRQKLVAGAMRKAQTDYSTAAWMDRTLNVYEEARAVAR
jgi:glycosyltransferase involved in cell wall biosynthesis